MTTRREFLQGSAAALAALGPLGLVGCGSDSILTCPDPRTPGTWNNALDTIAPVKPELLAYPSTATALVALVQYAEKKKLRVRMTGSGHSFSDVAVNDDVLLLPQRLTASLELDKKRLKPEAAADVHLVRTQSGATIRTLNDRLDKRRLALANLGGYDAQTIAGVAMTATHGSGLAYGPIASQIVSFQIVVAGGEILQLEPTNGITDPARFPHTLEEDPDVPVRLVQDDKKFYSAIVSMGSMGIVYSVVVKTVDRFWLRESRTLHTWNDLAKKGGYLEDFLRRPRDPAYPDHLEVTMNPYARPDGDHYAILTRRQRFAREPESTPESRTRGVLGDGNAFENFHIRNATEAALRDALDNAKPAALETLLTGFLFALYDKNYTNLSYKVFNIGSINRLKAFGIEMAFPMRDTFRAARALFEMAERERKEGRHHSVPVSFRFVRASQSPLAMQYGGDTVMMEIGAMVAARDTATLLKNYERFFIREFSARPHWGLDLSVLNGKAEVARLYPAFGDWLRAYDELNKTGTFDGRLTDRLGISKRPRTPRPT